MRVSPKLSALLGALLAAQSAAAAITVYVDTNATATRSVRIVVGLKGDCDHAETDYQGSMTSGSIFRTYQNAGSGRAFVCWRRERPTGPWTRCGDDGLCQVY